MIDIVSVSERSLSQEILDELYNIIIRAYALTEDQMWGDNYVRVSRDDFNQYLAADEFLFAFYDSRPAGGLRYYQSAPGVYGFGLFGVDFSFSRKGIGRALIKRVEDEAKIKGAEKIRIEILRPRDFELPIKSQLHGWYLSLGYLHTETVDFQKTFPDRAQGILVPCVFDIYEKTL